MPPEKRKATEEVATKHGFKNLEEWIAVTNSVAMSYAYVREGKSQKDLDAMVANAVAQAEADQKLTDEQREKVSKRSGHSAPSSPSSSLCRRTPSSLRR